MHRQWFQCNVGKALLSAALDNVASEPEHLFTLIARDTAAGGGFRGVTF